MTNERELLRRALLLLDYSRKESDAFEVEALAYLDTPSNDAEEPVATLDHNGNFELLRIVGVTFGQSIKLYEHPSSRKPFVRLSEDEIESLANSGLSPNWTDEFELYHFARAIEDALEEKNK